LQNAAVLVIKNFLWRVDPDQRTELIHCAITGSGADLHLFAAGKLIGQQSRQPNDFIYLIALQAQRLGIFFCQKLQRQNY